MGGTGSLTSNNSTECLIRMCWGCFSFNSRKGSSISTPKVAEFIIISGPPANGRAHSRTPPTAVVYNARRPVGSDHAHGQGLGPRKIRVNSINPGMVITEAVIRRFHRRRDSGKCWKRKRRSVRIGRADGRHRARRRVLRFTGFSGGLAAKTVNRGRPSLVRTYVDRDAVAFGLELLPACVEVFAARCQHEFYFAG